MPSRSSSRGRNPRVQRERQEYRPEGSERVSTPDGVAERGWVQVYTEDMIQRANNYTKQLYDKVDDLSVEVGSIESGIQAWVGPNGVMRKQTQEHKNIVSNLASLEKKIAAMEKAQIDKKMIAQNFKRIGDLEKKVASLEAELKNVVQKVLQAVRQAAGQAAGQVAGQAVAGQAAQEVVEVVRVRNLEHVVDAEGCRLIAMIHMIVV